MLPCISLHTSMLGANLGDVKLLKALLSSCLPICPGPASASLPKTGNCSHQTKQSQREQEAGTNTHSDIQAFLVKDKLLGVLCFGAWEESGKIVREEL
ncbi:hypothetical protein ElyMa_004114500 [Elysia marginata]|uniref:Uncharacterized protein n=1 Tax=Elysia marginata TaxID=1093978 RepID=A0AAV4GCN7_9GAST|nr:hypothetical protein ElyMa_004114500 [Elysia marginata]